MGTWVPPRTPRCNVSAALDRGSRSAMVRRPPVEDPKVVLGPVRLGTVTRRPFPRSSEMCTGRWCCRWLPSGIVWSNLR